MRARLKKGLDRLGLLRPARRVRQELQIASFRRRNARFRHGTAPDGVPIPPVRLIMFVTGTPDIEWFLTGGRLAADSIRSVLSRNGVDIDRVRAILDFGCGCGRVVRYWAGVGGEAHGCDYNRRLVEWCRRHVRFGRFELNDFRPPLPYPDGRFDLVYALSVFTHLSEELQRPWIEELRRILEPGGHLFLSLHGPRYREELRPEERRRFDEGRLIVRLERSAGTNLCGAYHPVEYVRETLARGFTVLDYIPEGARGNPYQDLVLLRKPFSPR
jgi:SAM-dependent methyltransferase